MDSRGNGNVINHNPTWSRQIRQDYSIYQRPTTLNKSNIGTQSMLVPRIIFKGEYDIQVLTW